MIKEPAKSSTFLGPLPIFCEARGLRLSVTPIEGGWASRGGGYIPNSKCSQMYATSAQYAERPPSSSRLVLEVTRNCKLPPARAPASAVGSIGEPEERLLTLTPPSWLYPLHRGSTDVLGPYWNRKFVNFEMKFTVYKKAALGIKIKIRLAWIKLSKIYKYLPTNWQFSKLDCRYCRNIRCTEGVSKRLSGLQGFEISHNNYLWGGLLLEIAKLKFLRKAFWNYQIMAL